MTCIPFLYNSGRPLYSFTDMSSCKWLDFYSKLLQLTFLFLAHLCPYWNTMWFLLNSLLNSDWLLYQQGLIMLLCWEQICAFRFLLFWYKLPQLLDDKLESFSQLFCNEVFNSVPFFLWIPPRVSRLWTILFWKCINFFTRHWGFLHINSFTGMLQVSFLQEFKVHGFMDVCATFLIWGSLMKDLIGV